MSSSSSMSSTRAWDMVQMKRIQLGNDIMPKAAFFFFVNSNAWLHYSHMRISNAHAYIHFYATHQIFKCGGEVIRFRRLKWELEVGIFLANKARHICVRNTGILLHIV